MIKTISPVEAFLTSSFLTGARRCFHPSWHRVPMLKGELSSRPAAAKSSAVRLSCSINWKELGTKFDQTADKWEEDLNRLHTALNAAVEAEDYTSASLLRDQISAISGFQADDRKKHSLDWKALGVPDWLVDRLERMGFRLPTQVQRNAMKAISQKAVFSSRDTVIRSPTGSGKTLSYLVPLLSWLSDDLLDEDLSTYLSRFTNKESTKSQKISKVLEDEIAPAPLAVIVVPTRELGVQVSMLCYQLLGGSRRNPTLQPNSLLPQVMPGNRLNMFKYTGPRRAKVMGVWDDQTLNASMPIEDFGLNILKGAHIIVATPTFLQPLVDRGHIPFENARFVVVDEADECITTYDDELSRILLPFREEFSPDGSRRVRVMVGASMLQEQVQRSMASGWMKDPLVISESAEMDGKIDLSLRQTVPSSLVHNFVECEEWQSLSVLVKLMRQEILSYERAGGKQPRIIIYARDVDSAIKIASPLQNALWTGLGSDVEAGLWGLSVLLPSEEDRVKMSEDNVTMLTYESSLRVMEQFYFNQVSVLVTTPLATRGLDFPNVTHVFNLGIVGTAADYLHRAGRVGRIGQDASGTVTSILGQQEARLLQQLGDELKFEPEKLELGEATQMTEESSESDKVRFLEDIFQLLDGPEEEGGSKRG
uniref:RNA helicase n=2 Tax=Guillardia theta TaxID=55529 RepID=A0A7S4JGV2_GUITH